MSPAKKKFPAPSIAWLSPSARNLRSPDDVLKELKASSFQPVSQSVAALRAYNLGIGLQRDGKNLEAQKQFEDGDQGKIPSFALAFSRLAQTYSSLGYDDEAEQSAQKAVTLSQDLPEAEKYLIAAIRSQVTKNYPEAIKAYENLAKASPGNSDVQSALASLYEDTGDFAKATRIQPEDSGRESQRHHRHLGELGVSPSRAARRKAVSIRSNRALTLSRPDWTIRSRRLPALHYMAVAYGC